MIFGADYALSLLEMPTVWGALKVTTSDAYPSVSKLGRITSSHMCNRTNTSMLHSLSASLRRLAGLDI